MYQVMFQHKLLKRFSAVKALSNLTEQPNPDQMAQQAGNVLKQEE